MYVGQASGIIALSRSCKAFVAVGRPVHLDARAALVLIACLALCTAGKALLAIGSSMHLDAHTTLILEASVGSLALLLRCEASRRVSRSKDQPASSIIVPIALHQGHL